MSAVKLNYGACKVGLINDIYLTEAKKTDVMQDEVNFVISFSPLRNPSYLSLLLPDLDSQVRHIRLKQSSQPRPYPYQPCRIYDIWGDSELGGCATRHNC